MLKPSRKSVMLATSTLSKAAKEKASQRFCGKNACGGTIKESTLAPRSCRPQTMMPLAPLQDSVGFSQIPMPRPLSKHHLHTLPPFVVALQSLSASCAKQSPGCGAGDGGAGGVGVGGGAGGDGGAGGTGDGPGGKLETTLTSLA